MSAAYIYRSNGSRIHCAWLDLRGIQVLRLLFNLLFRRFRWRCSIHFRPHRCHRSLDLSIWFRPQAALNQLQNDYRSRQICARPLYAPMFRVNTPRMVRAARRPPAPPPPHPLRAVASPRARLGSQHPNTYIEHKGSIIKS